MKGNVVRIAKAERKNKEDRLTLCSVIHIIPLSLTFSLSYQVDHF